MTTTEAKRVYLQNENDEILLPYSSQAIEDGDGNVIADTYLKRDVSPNITTSGKSFVAGLAMPSAKFENQTVGASGAIYVAPANGWYCGVCREGGIRLSNQSVNNFGVHSSQTAWSGGKAYIPCQKGDKIAFEYAGTTKELTFYYAEGDVESEV